MGGGLLGDLLSGSADNSNQSGNEAAGDLGNLVTGILGGGNSQQPQAPAAGNDPLGGLLGGLMGGGGQQSAGDPLGGLLGGLLGGNQQSQAPAAGNDPLGGLLGSLMGGGGQQSGGSPLGSILGSVVGSSQGSGNPLMDALGGLLGGGLGGGLLGAGAGVMGNSLLSPIAGFISQKMGIPMPIAMMVVSFAASKLFKGATQGPIHGRQLADVVDHNLLNQVAGGQVNHRNLRGSGMVDELMDHTGLDRSTATKSLQAVFNQFGAQLNQ